MRKLCENVLKGVVSSAVVVGTALCTAGCDDEPAAPRPRVDAVQGRTTVPTGTPASTAMPTASAAPVRATASATAAAAVPFQLRPARKMRDGERAAAERAFSKYARLDFTQSFVVELDQRGSCSFVAQTTEAATRARIVAGGAGSATAPPARPIAAATGAPTAGATAAPAATGNAAVGDERAELSFHLLCPGKGGYDFPDFKHAEASWTYHAMDAVGFSDIDGDGDTDVIVIASYLTGVGPDGTKPFPVVIVYGNDGKTTFSLLTDLSNELTKAGLDTMAKVIAHLRKKQPGG